MNKKDKINMSFGLARGEVLDKGVFSHDQQTSLWAMLDALEIAILDTLDAEPGDSPA